MPDYIDKINVNGTEYNIKGGVDGNTVYYGTCATAAATVLKEATIADFPSALTTGLKISVRFTNANTATNPTLSINSGTAVAIKRYGTTAVSTSAASSWNAGSIVSMTYDGTYWIIDNWLNSTYSAISQANIESLDGTSAGLITGQRFTQGFNERMTSSAVTNALGYTPYDSANPNGYTSNTGTVTSVGLSNATDGGLSISGSPITSSGSITVGHSNVLSSAQSTQAIYPITIDKNGHISAYGNAVDPEDVYFFDIEDSLSKASSSLYTTTATPATISAAIDAGKLPIARYVFEYYYLCAMEPQGGGSTKSGTPYNYYFISYDRYTWSSIQVFELITDDSVFSINHEVYSYAAFNHGHGYMGNDGSITAGIATPASGDYIIISDNSNQDMINRGIAIGSDTTKFLRNDGTWQTVTAGVSDVQVGGTSILSGGVANIITNSTYNSSTNKIATMSDVPSVTNTYSSTGTTAVTGTAVNAALQTLDSSITATTGQAISAITVTDGKITSSSKINVGDANQNAFSNVKVGSTTIAADTTTDTLELVAGTGITLTPDATNDKVTIASTASGDNSYRVTLSYDSTNDSFSTDKTYAEIVAAINSGKQAYIYDNTGYHKYTVGSYELGVTDIFAWCVSTGAVGAGALYNLNFTCYNLLLKAEIIYTIDSSDNVNTVTNSMDASSAVTDVRINNSSIVTAFGNSRIANFSTNTAYNSSTNKIATMADIGSDAYKITLSHNSSTGYSIDRTYAEVEAAVLANKYVYIYDNTLTVEAGYQGSTIIAPFACMAPSEDWFFFYTIVLDYNSEETIVRYLLADDGVWVDQYSLAPELPYVNTGDNGKVLKVVNGAWSAATESSGGGLFLVNFSLTSGSSYTADKTFAQIVSAVNSGSVVMGCYGGSYYSLTYFNEGDEQVEGDIRFERYSANLEAIEWFAIDSLNYISRGNESPWETYTDNAIGNAMAASY